MGQFKKLDSLIDNCIMALKEQLANLSIGEMAGLQQWQEASVEMRALLQQSFELINEQTGSQGEIDRLKNSLADLAGLNNQLYAAAAKQRQIVSGRLSLMRKGKSALGGYSGRVQTNKPRFVSSNG